MFENDTVNLLGYLSIFIVFVVVFTLEVIAPASGNQCDKRWRLYAGFINLLQITILISAGILFREWFEKNSLASLPNNFPLLANAFLIFFCSSFFAYWWHRATHKFDSLWRVFHQLHHSPSRIESLTAFYVHPFDGLAALSLNFIVAFWIFGAEANVATLAIVIAAIYNIYVHSDTRSPKWLGFFINVLKCTEFITGKTTTNKIMAYLYGTFCLVPLKTLMKPNFHVGFPMKSSRK